MIGFGIVRGLLVTARNLTGSYHDPKRLVTVRYPEETLQPNQRARVVPFLVYDGENAGAGLRCTACTICEQECPAQCIYIVKDAVKKPDHLGKPQFQPKTFDIDISVCMGCGICAEVCPFDSIKMDIAYNWATGDRFAATLLHKEQISKPNSYFASVHPDDARETDAARTEEKVKAEAKAKTKVAALTGTAAPAAAAKAGPAS